MSKIYVELLGTPLVRKDEEEIIFPYSKVKALFFYLILNKKTSRDEVAGLLWGDDSEDIAKKNLRNALYQLKKSFDLEIVETPNNSILILNDTFDFYIDVDQFISDPKNNLDLYRSDFLKGFFVKKADSFEEWVFENKYHYKSIYIKTLESIIESLSLDNPDVEKHCKKLISLDELNEHYYRTLIRHYGSIGSLNKVIDSFNEISQVLNRELGVSPSKETENLFNSIISSVKTISSPKNTLSELFFGRSNELAIIQNNYNSFLDNKDFKSILVSGEAGIGKSRLVQEFLNFTEGNKVHVLKEACYMVEKEYILKPWGSILEQIYNIFIEANIEIPQIWHSTLDKIFPELIDIRSFSNIKILENMEFIKYEMLQDIILDIFKKLSMDKKIVLVFDDIQWMDAKSISILNSLLLSPISKNLLAIFTYRNEQNLQVERFLSSLSKYNKLNNIHLNRFESQEVEKFIKIALPKKKFNKNTFKKIYEETEGNSFFLIEYLNSIKENKNINIMSLEMKDALKNRFIYLSKDSIDILNIVSLFFDKAPLSVLRRILDKGDLEIIDSLEVLENKFILEEFYERDNIYFKFTHQKLREYIYLNQSETRKNILHEKVADILEDDLLEDIKNIDLYHKLIYHYSNSNNKFKVLKYKISALDYYLSFSHELFPILDSDTSTLNKPSYLSESETISSLTEIENLLKLLKDSKYEEHNLRDLELSYLHIKGRYLIRAGEYDLGLRVIYTMIDLSLEGENNLFLLEGYKQIVYYGIQTNNLNLMIDYLDKALYLANDLLLNKEIGILYRLKGLYYILSKEYDLGEDFLNKSIEKFQFSKEIADKYALNIAAAYNYIGDIYKFKKNYKKALTYYNESLKISQNKDSLSSLAMFNINIGESYFYIGEYDLSKKYFLEASYLYEKFDLIWKKSILDVFLSLIYLEEKKYVKALKALEEADRNAKKIKNTYELLTVSKVKKTIKVQVDGDPDAKKTFKDYFKS